MAKGKQELLLQILMPAGLGEGLILIDATPVGIEVLRSRWEERLTRTGQPHKPSHMPMLGSMAHALHGVDTGTGSLPAALSAQTTAFRDMLR